MLVLSRKKDERIVFDLRNVDWSQIPVEDRIVEVTVVDIRGDKVRQGVSAPRAIEVHRNEVFESIQSDRAGSTVRAKQQPPH